jgi:hypothetical protein
MKNARTLISFSICLALMSWACGVRAKDTSQYGVNASSHCSIEQEEPILKSGPTKKLNRSLSLRLCGNDHVIWLAESDASGRTQDAARQIQVLKLPSLGPGEKYDIAVGACSSKKKPVMKPIVVRAKWDQKSKISAGRGLVGAWWYDADRDTVVERTIVDLSCESDTP